MIDLYHRICALYRMGEDTETKEKSQSNLAVPHVTTKASRETRLFLLLTKKDLQSIGARVIPEMLKKQGDRGGHDRDRTCDPYHVKVVLSR